MVFVVNEWIWADLAGTNGIERQRTAVEFIDQFARSDHQIVLIEGSKSDQKAWALCKDLNQVVRSIGAQFVLRIRQNSDRCRILTWGSVPDCPHQVVDVVKPADRYLVQAQMAVGEATIVTTDIPLLEALTSAGITAISRELFLRDHFGLT